MENEPTLIIMLRDPETGLFTGEWCRVQLDGDTVYIAGLWASPAANGDTPTLILRLTTAQTLSDVVCEAVDNYYEEERVAQAVTTIKPLEDTYNPTWEVTLTCGGDAQAITQAIQRVLTLHKAELAAVYALLHVEGIDAP